MWRRLRGQIGGLGDVGFLVYAVVLTLSLTLNVRLALNQQRPAPVFRDSGFDEGTVFPKVIANELGAERHVVEFSRKTLVYTFSPSCDWTRRDYRNLLAIHAAVKHKYDFLGIVLSNNREELDEYLATHPFPGRVMVIDESMVGDTPEDALKKLATTPQLLVVDRGGRIQRSWSGALFDRRQAEVEDLFNLKLPGAEREGVPPVSGQSGAVPPANPGD